MHPPITPVRLELKYCERCGGLWLRQLGTMTAYCVRCSQLLSDRRPPGVGGAPHLPVFGKCGLPERRESAPPASADPAEDPPARRGRPPLFLVRQADRPEIRRIQ
jgi:hypothetical protein